MLVAFLVFAIIFFAFLLILLYYVSPSANGTTTVPGPEPSDSATGNLLDIRDAGSMHEYLTKLHNQFGEIISFLMGEKLIISVASPQLFKETSKLFDRPIDLFSLLEPMIGWDSIQFANGVDGRKRRRVYDAAYSHHSMPYYYELFTENTMELCRKLNSLPLDTQIPVQEYMLALAIKNITRTSLGENFSGKQCLELKNEYSICWNELESRLAGDIPLPDSERVITFNNALQQLKHIFKDAIDKRRNITSNPDEKQLIDLAIDNEYSDEVIFSDMLTFIVGGFHTTAQLLVWAIHFLTIYPDIEVKLETELKNVLDNKEISPSNIADLVYMKQFLEETIRWSAIATMSARYSEYEMKLSGHTIPAKTPIINAIGVVLEDANLWDEPQKFDPDRFAPENIRSHNNFEFQPFGSGKRMCPGYRFAYVEATVILSMLIPKFKFNSVNGETVKKHFGFVTKPSSEVYVTVEKK